MEHKPIQDAITLLVVINPMGAVPLYLAVTAGMDKAQRLRVARRACVIATGILLAFVVVGEVVLDGLGVQLPAFRAAGGLVLLVVGLRIVLNTEASHPFALKGEGHDVAVFPLATPSLAGPGAIMAAVLLTDNDRFGVQDQALTALVVAALLAITYVVLASADALHKRVGSTGAAVVSRVFGLVLTALAMQTLLEGLRPYLESIR